MHHLKVHTKHNGRAVRVLAATSIALAMAILWSWLGGASQANAEAPKPIARRYSATTSAIANTNAITPTNEWVNFYSQSTTFQGTLVPVGTVIKAYSPRGVLAGQFTVSTAGWYGLMPVYRDDPATSEDEGLRPGETIAFTINDIPAAPLGPDVPVWTTNGDVKQVNLAASVVIPTNEWVNFYGQDSLLNGQPLPVGAVVRAYSPSGTQGGEFVVDHTGWYGPMPVYRDDPNTTVVEGLAVGEIVSFTVNAIAARPLGPDQPIWTTNGDLKQVDLNASLDVTAPVISNISINNVTGSGATIQWVTNEGATSQVEYGLNDTYGSLSAFDPLLVASHSVTLNNLTDSTTYHFRVRSRDGSRNLAVSNDQTGATVDTTPPHTSILSGPVATVPTTTVSFQWTGSDNLTPVMSLQYSWMMDYQGWSTYSSVTQTTFSNVSEGNHTFYVMARDAAANVDPYPASRGFAADTTGPSLFNIQATGVYSAGATITWNTNEPGDSQVEYGLTNSYGLTTTLDANLNNLHTVPVTGLSLSVPYHFRVRSHDGVGNLSVSSDNVFTTIDSTPPHTFVTFGPSSAITATNVTFQWNGSDDVSPPVALTYSYQFDNGGWSSFDLTTSHTFSALAEGNHAFQVRARDQAGNVDPNPATRAFSIDATAPVISNVQISNVTASAATVNWSTNELADSEVEYGATSTYGSSSPLDPVLTTSHAVRLATLTTSSTFHFRILSRDQVGNIAASDDQILYVWPSAPITPTNEWVNFYSQNSALNGQPLPAGTVIRAFNPRGVQAGHFVVNRAGWYGLMPVYTDDPSTSQDEGLRLGETVRFAINGVEAKPLGPDDAIWNGNGSIKQVDLSATSVIPTNEWVNFYSQNTTLNGQLIPIGAVIRAYNPRGVLCGEFTVDHAGWYGLLPVYRDDPNTPQDEGMRPGETVTFTINDITATVLGPDTAVWTTHGDLRQVNLTSKAATTTTLVSSSNPAPLGQAVTFTATVTVVAPGTGTPSGTIGFWDGTTSLGTATLGGGSATLTTTSLSLGSHSMTAMYNGDANFAESTSVAVSQTISKPGTTTTLSVSPNPSIIGQSVTFTATVTATPPGNGMPTGNVSFQDGTTTIGSGTLAGGTAVLTTSLLALGSHSITATYNGDSNFDTSASVPLVQIVGNANTTTTISSSPNPSVFGQSVTLTATVNAVLPATGVPTGTVTFREGIATLGIATLSGGQAASMLLLPSGTHSITATYDGNTDFNSSTSAILTQIISRANTTTTISSAANTPVVGQSVTFTATVTAQSPGAGSPTGIVEFKDGTTTLGTGTLDASRIATTTISFSTTGPHTITAAFEGDANFNPSTSTGISQTVTKASTTIAITRNTRNPSVVGESVSVGFSITVTPPGAGTLTGSIVVTDGTTSCTTTLPSTSCNLMFATAGPKTLIASYAGDSSFNGSTSSPVPQTVNKADTVATVASSGNPSSFGQPVIFTATVGAISPGGGTPSSTIEFRIDGTAWTSISLTGGHATTPAIATLSSGNHTITAVYSGDNDYGASSAMLAGGQTVGKATSWTILTSSANPSTLGQSVTFTATVSSTLGIPSGIVTFTDGIALLGTRTLNASGVATFATSALDVGSHTITAEYAGDSNYAGSSSAIIVQQVNNPMPTLTQVIPSYATVGGSGFTLNITGTNFVNGSTVSWNGTNLPASFVSSTNLTATVASTLIATSDVAYVTVTNPLPGGGISNPQGFWTTQTGAAVTLSAVGSNVGNPGSLTISTGMSNGVTVTATGSGTVSVAHYASNPAAAPSFTSAGAFIDVHIAAGSSFTSLSIVDCNLNGGNVVYWWNGSTWVVVSNQTYNPVTHCTTIAVNSSTAPSLSDLGGTYFGSGVDTTMPTVTISGTSGGASYSFGTWTKQNVQVTLDASDGGSGSGVKEMTYSAIGAQSILSTTVSGPTAAFWINAEGTTTISYYAIDFAGNSASTQTATAKIDKTAPAVTITAPANGAIYKLKQAAIANYSCGDLPSGANSGVASCSGPVASGANLDTSSLGPKSFTVTAADNVGNTTSKTNSYTIVPATTYLFLPLIAR